MYWLPDTHLTMKLPDSDLLKSGYRNHSQNLRGILALNTVLMLIQRYTVGEVLFPHDSPSQTQQIKMSQCPYKQRFTQDTYSFDRQAHRVRYRYYWWFYCRINRVVDRQINILNIQIGGVTTRQRFRSINNFITTSRAVICITFRHQRKRTAIVIFDPVKVLSCRCGRWVIRSDW